MIYLTKEQFFEIINHCQTEYPKEACGILAGKIVQSSNFIVKQIYKMTNISENPQTCFYMKPEEQIKVNKEMRQSGIEMVGIYHSHSTTIAYPSERDVSMAFYPEVDYVIISLRNFNNPEVGNFKIVEGKIIEEKIIIRKNILFICIENSCRSQMAEAIVNNFYWQKFVGYSAGSKPLGQINPKAIEVMREIGVDISNQKSKGFDEIKNIKFDYVITMGCGEICPVYPSKYKLDWQIDDPKDKGIEYFREVRDEIRKKIDELVESDKN